MTGQEAIKRNEKAQGLKVWQVDETWFYVESEDGKIAYKCCITDQGDYCNCGDFGTRAKNDPSFKCKHILAVMNSIPKNEVTEAQILEKRKPKLDERFIKQVEGKDFVLYSGLLDLAHQKNLVSIDVELIQYPSKENDHTAVCKAIARTVAGGPFIDVGDANPMNCNSKVAKHIIRMASTRAKARCLRDLTNIGMTALEELGDFNEVISEDHVSSPPVRKGTLKKFPVKQTKSAPSGNGNGDGKVTVGHGEAKSTEPDQNETKSAPGCGNQDAEVKTDAAAAAPSEKTAAPEKPVKNRRASKSGNGDGSSKDKTPMMSEAQKNAIYNLSRRRNISVEELGNLAMKTFNMPLESLTASDASMFIRTLQQAS